MALLRAPSDNYATDYTSDTFRSRYRPFPEVTCQVEITSAGTVSLQGKSELDAPWHELKSYTASGADQIVVMPYMQAVATGVSGGDVKVWINAD